MSSTTEPSCSSTHVEPVQHQPQDPVEEGFSMGNDISTPESLEISEEEEAIRLPPPVEADAVDEMLGVSMSPIQTRMKARQTPAAEKTKAMSEAEGYFNLPSDAEAVQVSITDNIRRDQSPSADANTAPEEDESKQHREDDDHKDDMKWRRSSVTLSFLKGGLSYRRRAGSGDSLSNLSFKKFLPDLSSFSKLVGSIPSSRPSPTDNQPRQLLSTKVTMPVSDSELTSSNGRDPLPETRYPRGRQKDGFTNLEDVQPISALVQPSRPPPSIRRSSSDHSLYIRSLSRTSTLEHRPYYEHVHSQVNSRVKAIKDTLQDSSSRLLSMPNFNLGEFRTEWIPRQLLQDMPLSYARSGSDTALVQKANRNHSSPIGLRPSNSPAGTAHPRLKRAVSQMTGDVVVMGGYRGSVLRSAKPPHRQLWFPMKVGLNIRKVDLEVGLTPEDEERMEETIIASESLSHIGPVDVCRRLINKLKKSDNAQRGDLRVWDYGYDWRLSPHFLSQRLVKFLERLPCNAPNVPKEKRGAWVIAHSLGGLITRHAVNQRPELFAGVLYAGSPQHCVNILGPLRNGDDVLLSSKVLTAQVNFTTRTSYIFLPEDGRCFINKDTKEEYPVDFFDVSTWDEYRFSPCIAEPLPPFDTESRKGLIDSLPASFSSLPKIGLSKRLSSIRGYHNKEAKEAVDELTIRHKNQYEAIKDGPKEQQQQQEVEEEEEGEEEGLLMKAVGLHASATDPLPSVDNVVGPTAVFKTSKIRPASAGVCTIPRAEAVSYLQRTLDDCRRFKRELAFNEEHQSNNVYPPFSVLYAKSLPTVYGAKVASREQIKCWNAYDDLAFAAGDGVCLAAAAMLPAGYRVIKDGLVKTDRGHIGLLGDLESVGQCLQALIDGRTAGVGMGVGRAIESQSTTSLDE